MSALILAAASASAADAVPTPAAPAALADAIPIPIRASSPVRYLRVTSATASLNLAEVQVRMRRSALCARRWQRACAVARASTGGCCVTLSGGRLPRWPQLRVTARRAPTRRRPRTRRCASSQVLTFAGVNVALGRATNQSSTDRDVDVLCDGAAIDVAAAAVDGNDCTFQSTAGGIYGGDG